ncbi:MAG: SMI1/KNR4 family protein [Alphaproteobacteria bacterium]|nr:SMI1/KNR4 family protein [Alphaproteobacteria bacterium]
MKGWWAVGRGLDELLAVHQGVVWLQTVEIPGMVVRLLALDPAHRAVLAPVHEGSVGFIGQVALPCGDGVVWSHHQTTHHFGLEGERWSAAGRLLAVGGGRVVVHGDGTIRGLDATSGEEVSQLQMPIEPASAVQTVDRLALVVHGEAVVLGLDGEELERLDVGEDGWVGAADGEVVFGVVESGREGPRTRIRGAREREIPGTVSSFAASGSDIAVVTHHPVRGAGVILERARRRHEVWVEARPGVRDLCWAEGGALGAAVGGVLVRLVGDRLQAVRTDANAVSVGVWDGVPLVLADGRLFVWGAELEVPPWMPPAVLRRRGDVRHTWTGGAQLAAGGTELYVHDPAVLEALSVGDTVEVELETSALGTSLVGIQEPVSWRPGPIRLCPLEVDAPTPAGLLARLEALGRSVEPALRELIEEPPDLGHAGFHLRASGRRSAVIEDPCLLDLGHDGRGNLFLITVYPPDPRTAVVRWHSVTRRCTWVADSVADFLAGVRGDPRPAQEPAWFTQSHGVEPALDPVAIRLLEDPLRMERAWVRAGTLVSHSVAPIHRYLGWPDIDGLFDETDPWWLPFRESVAHSREVLTTLAGHLGLAEGALTRWLDRVVDDPEHRATLYRRSLEPWIHFMWPAPDPGFVGLGHQHYLYVYPGGPGARLGIVRTHDNGPVWVADDAVAFLDGLPGSLDREPDAAPAFACMHGDAPCPTEERQRLKDLVTADPPHLRDRLRELYVELGWPVYVWRLDAMRDRLW